MRKCKDCHEYRPESEFRVRKRKYHSKRHGHLEYFNHVSYCRRCENLRHNLYKQKYRDTHPEVDWYADVKPYPTMLCNMKRTDFDAPQPVAKIGRPSVEVVKLRAAA